ncbi:MAG: hypothetical protein ACLQFR_11240 [Streptosporangiaceae bacterium]
MNSDLQGELGPLDPGLDQLIELLTANPDSGELAGEQAALAMFRDNSRASAGPSWLRGGAAGKAGRTTRPAGRAARISARWTLRVAGATALTLAGGLTAAAYANVLPAPVQHLAHVALSFADVPDAHHTQPRRRPPVQHSSSPAGGQSSSPGSTKPAPSRRAPASPRPTTARSAAPSASPTPAPSASPSRSVAAGPLQLTASRLSSPINAGSAAVIDGQLTKAGNGLAGATITLLDRQSRHEAWQVAGTGVTNAAGDVSVTSPAITTNTAFRLTGPDGASSAIVRVTVRPAISVVLDPGTSGLRDALVVSTQYARRGNIVVLQIESSTGAWVDVRGRTLNANGQARFSVSAAKLQNRVLRVRLLATVRHAAAVSNTVTVPPPN